jgi:hypothetical protein
VAIFIDSQKAANHLIEYLMLFFSVWAAISVLVVVWVLEKLLEKDRADFPAESATTGEPIAP